MLVTVSKFRFAYLREFINLYSAWSQQKAYRFLIIHWEMEVNQLA